MSTLTTKDLTIGYKKEKPLFKNMDLKFSQGDFIALLGQNGVGKTTLMKTLCGLHKPVSGNIYIDSLNIVSLSSLERAKKISVVLTQRPNIINFSVFEFVSFGKFPYTNWLGSLNDSDIDHVNHIVEIVGLKKKINQKISKLSDGQSQKVMIARALAQDTDFVFLDEPTSYLDIKNKFEILTLLKTIAKDLQKGILISTHELSLASQLCDNFWCMSNDGVFFQELPKKSIDEKEKLMKCLQIPNDFIL